MAHIVKHKVTLFCTAAVVGGLAFIPSKSHFEREAIASTEIPHDIGMKLESAGEQLDPTKTMTALRPDRQYGNSNSHHGSGRPAGYHGWYHQKAPSPVPRPRPAPVPVPVPRH